MHLSGELFKRMTGIEMTHVPYRGSAPALQDVIAGRLDLIFDNITAALPQVKSGNGRGLAVTTGARRAVAPELPTIAEAGVPGFDVSSWFAFFVPAKTPAPIIEKMHKDIVAALAYPPVEEERLEPARRRAGRLDARRACPSPQVRDGQMGPGHPRRGTQDRRMTVRKSMINRRRLISLAAASALAPSFSTRPAYAQAQAWPRRFVRLVAPFPAGGGTDAVARASPTGSRRSGASRW